MEIYSDLKNQESKEFEKLLDSQYSKVKIEEGKVISCTVVKITDKFGLSGHAGYHKSILGIRGWALFDPKE